MYDKSVDGLRRLYISLPCRAIPSKVAELVFCLFQVAGGKKIGMIKPSSNNMCWGVEPLAHPENLITCMKNPGST